MGRRLRLGVSRTPIRKMIDGNGFTNSGNGREQGSGGGGKRKKASRVEKTLKRASIKAWGLLRKTNISMETRAETWYKQYGTAGPFEDTRQTFSGAGRRAEAVTGALLDDIRASNGDRRPARRGVTRCDRQGKTYARYATGWA
jgi:hypothetical protein